MRSEHTRFAHSWFGDELQTLLLSETRNMVRLVDRTLEL